MSTDGARSADRGATPPESPALDQAFDGDSLYALRAAVSAHASAAGLSRQRVYDVVAAAHELAANAVRHGAGRGRLLLWTDDRSLYCKISDDGPEAATGESQGRATAQSTRWRTSRGHGLWVVGQVADRFTVDHTSVGTSATIAFMIALAGEPHPAGSRELGRVPVRDQQLDGRYAAANPADIGDDDTDRRR